MKTLLLASVAASVLPVAFMSDILETVIVGGVRVNKAEYDADPDGFEGRYNKAATDRQEEPAQAGLNTTVAPGLEVPPAPSAPVSVLGDKVVAPTVPSPDQKLVAKEGKKFFVVRPDGTRIEDVEGIDKAGYTTEKAAWDAIMALPH